MDSTDVRRRWADRSGEYSPEFYAQYGPDESTAAVRRLLERHGRRDGSVLELGCSSGRHLAHLRERGFDSLAGIEVNEDAFDVMADVYPDLAAAGTFHHCGIEDAVETFEDDAFDAVYSVETLQHLHPDLEWVFAEVARITGDVLVTVENEGPTDRSAADAADGSGTGRVDRSGTARTGPSETERSGRADGRETGRSGDGDVTYVDGLPLYYRDWNRVFTAQGFEEVAVERVGRDTVRAFRATET